ncbi:hypothetical protein CS053_00745 [Rhodanobacter glycinis]|uniref:Bacteriocin n=1 Tax=Rhodanobacter glycinis TaxID=582702 RepID=A0A5B9DYW6_9GAMM|nr:hypothetical protein [Rhodanobacter glycinis]QEE23187.1 hypothetical protein CS053_00745 [Rhodanobacter glycinis]
MREITAMEFDAVSGGLAPPGWVRDLAVGFGAAAGAMMGGIVDPAGGEVIGGIGGGALAGEAYDNVVYIASKYNM